MDASCILFYSALGAAVGGALIAAIITFFSWWKNWIGRTYYCCSDNHGQKDEVECELKHNFGKKVDEKEVKKLKLKHPVWEWNRKRTGDEKGASCIYGPYSTDFSDKPGNHTVTFRIRGMNFSIKNKTMKNIPILMLEVAKGEELYFKKKNDKFEKFQPQYIIARRLITAKDLIRKGWKKYKLKFYGDGKGLWEYRIDVYDGTGNILDNIKKFGEKTRIFFDTIHVA